MTKQTMEIEITSNFDDVCLEFDKLISKVDELKKIIINVHLSDKYEANMYIAEMTKRNLIDFIK